MRSRSRFISGVRERWRRDWRCCESKVVKCSAMCTHVQDREEKWEQKQCALAGLSGADKWADTSYVMTTGYRCTWSTARLHSKIGCPTYTVTVIVFCGQVPRSVDPVELLGICSCYSPALVDLYSLTSRSSS